MTDAKEKPDDIPFDRKIEHRSGTLVEVAPGVRRIIAGNASPFTFTGTCTYVVGQGRVAVIDPGPEDIAHLDALLAALGTEEVAHILVTHTHRDHSPGARALKAETGAPIVGCGPHVAARELQLGETAKLDAANDVDHAPDLMLADGESVSGDGYTLEAVATPGHTMNHLAFAFPEGNALFSGDHVMAWSTTIVAPPDGSMRHYMASLEKLRTRPEAMYWPGHGGPVREPQRFVKALGQHRRHREQAILARLKAGDTGIEAIVARIYEGLNPALRGAAALSVFAHLEDLIARGLALSDGPPTLRAAYRAV